MPEHILDQFLEIFKTKNFVFSIRSEFLKIT